MAISLDEAFENVVEYEKDADSSAKSNFVDEGDIPTNSTPNQSNSIDLESKIWLKSIKNWVRYKQLTKPRH